MPWNGKIFDVFLSNPGDLENEQTLVMNVIQDWNVSRGRATKTLFSVLTWKNAVSPELARRPQDVINRQIGDQYDIYLGMMWGKFGSNTGLHDSGTVEEFNRALDRYRSDDRIRLAMVFKVSDIPLKDLDGAQYAKVQGFKAVYSHQGGLYREFDSDDALRRIIMLLLEDIALSYNNHDQSDVVVNKGITPADDQSNIVDLEYEDMGIFDVNDKLSEVVLRLVEFLGEMTNISSENTEIISRISGQMNALSSVGQATQDNLRPLTLEVSKRMDILSEFIENHIASFMVDNRQIGDLTEAGLDISRDFDLSDRKQFLKAVEDTAAVLHFNAESNRSLASSIADLPRMDKKLNKARRRLISNLGALEEDTEKLSIRMSAALHNYGGEG